jgi:hypothetical protein
MGKITLSFTSPGKDFFFIFMKSVFHRKKKTLHYSLLSWVGVCPVDAPRSLAFSLAETLLQEMGGMCLMTDHGGGLKERESRSRSTEMGVAGGREGRMASPVWNR